MDTYLSKVELNISDRALETLILVLLCCFLIVAHIMSQPPIFANDLIANTSISAPLLNNSIDNFYEKLNPAEKFNRNMESKYSGYKVNKIDDGIVHVQMVRYFNSRPVRLNVVEINRSVAKNYEVKPAMAASENMQHKSTLRTIANRTNSVVAVNGGFFKPQSGVPLGTLMIDEKLYTGPIYDRVALGIFDDGYDVGRVQINATITGNNNTIKIDNINQPRMLSSYVLAYTRDWGTYAPVSPKYGVQLQVVGNKITKASANPLFIPEDGFVLVGPKDKLSKLFGAKDIDVKFSTNPQWNNVRHIISGGPYLVKNGEVFVDVSAQKLNAISGKNPRTAVGYTADNNLIIVTADGREGSSVGLTLWELAWFMKSLGCTNAINLDGGSSTVMYVKGQIVNHPQNVGGIALSNALVVSKKNKI